MNKLEKILLSGITALTVSLSADAQIGKESVSKNDYINSKTSMVILKKDFNKKHISKSVVKKCYDKASSIEYEYDSITHPNSFKERRTFDMGVKKIFEYWQSPEETKKSKKGDCEDRSIYLQQLLKNNHIKSKISAGKQDIIDDVGHAWIESIINDTLYVLDPGANKLFYRSGKNIKGNFNERRFYVLDASASYLNKYIKEYKKRNNTKLEFWNNLNEPLPELIYDVPVKKDKFDNTKQYARKRGYPIISHKTTNGNIYYTSKYKNPKSHCSYDKYNKMHKRR